ncbi:MAG: flotillin family protein [Candidatus Eremiobacteraeota bacterium]|nr:flotillin family protein [Candidatus Eremiobacteraeota bacterium]
MWRVAEPNEALIISGFRTRRDVAAPTIGESMGFKMVTGHGTLVIPGVQVVRKLSLDLNEAELIVDCVTQQGIPVHLKAVVIYKVGDDFVSIANAARRFLDQQDKMNARIQNVFAGHLRAICGSLTVEDLIRERDKLTEATRAAAGTEMEKLGLVIDSLQIQEIDDPTGYITNLAKPHAVAVLKDARIAEAHADREATQTEQQSAAMKAESVRDSRIKQAEYQADIDRAAAQAKMAGPLAEATAQQQVVVEETRVAQLEAERKEQELQVSVRKPADAAAYEKRTVAAGQRDADISASEARAKQVDLEAEANAKRIERTATAQAASTRQLGEAEAAATQAKGLAEGNAIKAKLMAEADAIRARAEALATNQEAVIGQTLAEKWPQIVEAASKAFNNIDQLVVLNGADGVSDILAKVMAQGAAGLGVARNLLANAGAKDARTPTNGTSSATELDVRAGEKR